MRVNYFYLVLVPLGIFAGLLLISIPLAHAFEPEAADCTPGNLEYIKFLYKENINGFNQAVILYEQQHPGYTMSSLAKYIYNPFLQKPADYAKCLRDLGVDPSSVAQPSAEFQKVLSYDPARLNQTSPDFVKYVPIPEFGSLSTLLLTILILGLVFPLRIFKNKK